MSCGKVSQCNIGSSRPVEVRTKSKRELFFLWQTAGFNVLDEMSSFVPGGGEFQN